MTSHSSTYPLRLPKSIKAAAAALAREEGIGLIQFVANAVAEKLAAMQTASFFGERRQRADLAAFRKRFRRTGGEPPRAGDERCVGGRRHIDMCHWPRAAVPCVAGLVTQRGRL
jgi:hypothetical protein